MDTFFEQIIPIKKTGKTWAAVIGIWFLAFILVFALIFFGSGFIGSIALLLAAGVIFGAYKLSARFSVEYEYIITNGTMDIDKITAKSTRKRVASFELSNVDRLEKYNPNARPVGNFEKTVIACNEDNSDAYLMVVSKEGKGSTLIVFAPDEKIRSAAVKFLPKYIANTAFR